MRSGPTAAAAVLLSLALILPGCGEQATPAADRDMTAPNGAQSPPNGALTTAERRGSRSAMASRRCRFLLGDFLDSMESLNNTVAVGLDYESYLGAVNNVRATYASVPAERLQFVCLAKAATPAEQALNAYIEAANRWGECLATSSCDPKSIEPQLQREWEEASDLLSATRSGLRNLG